MIEILAIKFYSR